MFATKYIRDNPDQKLIFWDFETCNANILGCGDNLPWQVGFLVCKGTQILEEHLHFIKWNPLPITAGAARITKFDWEEYKEKAENPKVVRELLEQYLFNPEYYNIAHNGLGFDVYVHNIWRRKMGKPVDWSFLKKTIDTHALAKGSKLGIKFNPQNDNFLSYQYRMLSIVRGDLKTNLTLLGKENKIEFDYDHLHNGLNDVKLLKLVWDTDLKWKFDI